MFGLSPNEDADCTACLIALFEAGGAIELRPRRYKIAAAGADAGGVFATLTQSIDVYCHPGVTFDAPDLDNDMFRFVPAAYSAANPIDIRWRGGFFDMRTQKNSTSVPFDETLFPPVNVGTSSTCDGLSFRGSIDSGGQKSGFGLVEVLGASFRSSDTDFADAGGDSHIYANGFRNLLIEGCSFYAARDVANYISRDGTGSAGGNATMRKNVYDWCVFGVSGKRGLDGFVVEDNHFNDCLIPVLANYIAGTTTQSIFTRNHMKRFWKGFRIDGATLGVIRDNTMSECGWKKFNGDVHTSFDVPLLLQARGARCWTVDLVCSSVVADFAAVAKAYDVTDYTLPDTTVQKSEYNRFTASIRGFAGLGGEQSGEADNNLFLFNLAEDASTKSCEVYGANSVQIAAGAEGYVSSAGRGTLIPNEFPMRLLWKLIGADMNTTNDQSLTKVGVFNNYIIVGIRVVNASTSLTTAAGGFYTGASKSGNTVVSAATTYTAHTGATIGSDLSISGVGKDERTVAALYLSLTTPQGGAATCDIYVYGFALS